MDNFTKITTGWVRQYYEKNENELFVCTGQEFKTGDIVEYVDDAEDDITPPKRKYRKYQPYDMVQPDATRQQEELLLAAQEIVSDFDNYEDVLQTGFDGGYGKDTAIYKLKAIVKQIEEG